MMESYKVIFFDAGGTLLHPYPSVGEIYAQVAARYGAKASSQEIEKRFREIWIQREGMAQLTVHSNEKVEKEWWRSLVAEVFAPYTWGDQFEKFFDELHRLFAEPEVWRLYPEVPEILETLTKKGKRLAVISNWDSRLMKLLERLGIAGYFEFILASAVFGSSKPGARIFEEALKRTGVRPEEALHIGDSFEDDIKGAAQVGIHSVLIDRHQHFKKDHKGSIQPTRIIGHLNELLKA